MEYQVDRKSGKPYRWQTNMIASEVSNLGDATEWLNKQMKDKDYCKPMIKKYGEIYLVTLIYGVKKNLKYKIEPQVDENLDNS